MYQIAGDVLFPIRNKLITVLHLNRESLGHKLFQIMGTFMLVNFSWIFFRANSFLDAIEIIKSIIASKNIWVLFDGSIYECGLDGPNFRLMIICIGILLFADCCKYKGIKLRTVILRQDYWFVWIFTAISVLFILLFGIYGASFDKSAFIYFQF